ncbi:hypothetical protein A176_001440 [Myxococcus hansupus]|uniref:Uncharacterized protein n=1 Tax=Pseudomyxococcus hansupus TaxID=1297742 RepID=A0A0H4WSJ9_9BACT|nr:hypothetical protein A176_001440 [Myxococcus hansupus]
MGVASRIGHVGEGARASSQNIGRARKQARLERVYTGAACLPTHRACTRSVVH